MTKKLTLKKDRRPTGICDNGIRIDSKAVHNDTLFDVTEGKTYVYKAAGTWYDNMIETDADGFEDGLMNLVAGRKQRVPEAPWFRLCGRIGHNGEPIILGKEGRFTAKASGRLYCFVNDVERIFTLHNNEGSVCLVIRELLPGIA